MLLILKGNLKVYSFQDSNMKLRTDVFLLMAMQIGLFIFTKTQVSCI